MFVNKFTLHSSQHSFRITIFYLIIYHLKLTNRCRRGVSQQNNPRFKKKRANNKSGGDGAESAWKKTGTRCEDVIKKVLLIYLAGDSNRNVKAMGVEKYGIKVKKNHLNEIVMKRVSTIMSGGGGMQKNVLEIIRIDNL